MLIEGKRYDDLIKQGAFPGVRPVRPGLPFPPTPVEALRRHPARIQVEHQRIAALHARSAA